VLELHCFQIAGCFNDPSTPSALNYRATELSNSNMTIEVCVSFCKGKSPVSRTLSSPIDRNRTGNSYRYAGLEYYGEVSNRCASSPSSWIGSLTMYSSSAFAVPRSTACRLMNRTVIVGVRRYPFLIFACLMILTRDIVQFLSEQS
jgi:hypothetical protein